MVGVGNWYKGPIQLKLLVKIDFFLIINNRRKQVKIVHSKLKKFESKRKAIVLKLNMRYYIYNSSCCDSIERVSEWRKREGGREREREEENKNMSGVEKEVTMTTFKCS